MKQLNSVIYNRLVKRFNDAANDPVFKQYRDQIIALRKQFPTYNELLALDLRYMDTPKIEGTEIYCYNWIGNCDPSIGSDVDTDIRQAQVVYDIGIVTGGDAKTGKLMTVLKIRGIPKFEFLDMHTFYNESGHVDYLKKELPLWL